MLPVETQDFVCGFAAIVGRPNVGKSTLMNHLIGQKISITSKKAQTTRHKITGIYTDKTAQFIFVDTPGFQTRHKNALNDRLNQNVTETLGSVDVIFWVIEAMKLGPDDLKLLKFFPKNIPVILVLNKVDQVKDKYALQAFSDNLTKEYSFVSVVGVSARFGRNLDSLLNTARNFLPVGIPLYPEDMVTDKTERFLATEIVREKLFRYLGEELPYAMNVQVESFTEEESGLKRIHIVVLVDKEGQKGMVIGKDGEKLKKISTESRLDMEKLFDSKVFLKVWVKVKSGWADDVRFLQEFGL